MEDIGAPPTAPEAPNAPPMEADEGTEQTEKPARGAGLLPNQIYVVSPRRPIIAQRESWTHPPYAVLATQVRWLYF